MRFYAKRILIILSGGGEGINEELSNTKNPKYGTKEWVAIENTKDFCQACYTTLSTLLLFIFVAVISSFFFFKLEEEWDFQTSLYFVVVTGSTVGYGILSPSTKNSRIFSCVFIPLSVTITANGIGRIIGAWQEYFLKKRLRALNTTEHHQELLAELDDIDNELTGGKGSFCPTF